MLAILYVAFIKLASAPTQNHIPPAEPPVPEPVPEPEPTPAQDPLLERKGSLKEPWEYKDEGECELIAKTYQNEYGGWLVFIAPYETTSGNWIIGDYAGEWINLVGSTYVDYQSQKVFTNQSKVIQRFNNFMKNKHNNPDVAVKVFIYGQDIMPYPIIWHY